MRCGGFEVTRDVNARETSEADHQIGDDHVFAAFAYPRADAPGQELRIAFDIGDQP